MKRGLVIIALGLLAVSTIMYGQTALPDKVNVFKPSVIDGDVIKENNVASILSAPYGQDEGRRSGQSYWVVFSDRTGNVTYTSPDGKTQYSKLKWGERLYIAEIRNGYAHVFYEPMNNYPKISTYAESRGWIPLTRLLLWDKVLSDRIGISHKAVICADLDKAGNVHMEAGRKLYSTPDGKEGADLHTDMHFYYILKRSGSRILLGLNATINSGADLFGWVDESSVVLWDYRTCLEPTWEPDDVKYFASNHAAWQVFPTKENMKSGAANQNVFTTNVRKFSESRYNGRYMYRTMPAHELRYPILDDSTDKIWHCTTFGTLGKGKGGTAVNRTAVEDAKRIGSENVAQRKIVNLVIAIDGTSSMKPYFKSVQQALNEVDKFFTDDDKINVGVVIYRDKEDGKYVTECFPSTGGFTEPRNQNLRTWLNDGGKYTIKSVARDKRESLYYGINTAIDQFFPSAKNMQLQSNILLVIGDCGDNGKFNISRQSLVDKLVAQNITLMGFQVTNRDDDDYACFNEQLTYLMRWSVQKRYDNVASTPQSIKPQVRADGRGVDMKNTESAVDFILGKHRYNPVKNKDMEVNVLTQSIEEVLSEWKESVNYVTIQATQLIDFGTQESFGEDDIYANQLNKDFVIKALGGNKALADVLAKQNALLSFKGYAYRKKDGRDLFKVVVFFPAGELRDLVRRLDKVEKAAQSDNPDRRPYYEAMMVLAKMTLAQDRVSTASYYEILAKAFGIANYTPKSGYTLEDILDPNVVSNQEYHVIVNEMESSIKRLKEVTYSNYPFLLTYSGNNDKYYWLPSEYLPL